MIKACLRTGRYEVDGLGEFPFEVLPRVGETIVIEFKDAIRSFVVKEVEHLLLAVRDPEFTAVSLLIEEFDTESGGLS